MKKTTIIFVAILAASVCFASVYFRSEGGKVVFVEATSESVDLFNLSVETDGQVRLGKGDKFMRIKLDATGQEITLGPAKLGQNTIVQEVRTGVVIIESASLFIYDPNDDVFNADGNFKVDAFILHEHWDMSTGAKTTDKVKVVGRDARGKIAVAPVTPAEYAAGRAKQRKP